MTRPISARLAAGLFARPWAGGVLAVLCGVVFAVVIVLMPPETYAILVLDNGTQMAAVSAAAVACVLAARAGHGRQRRAWTWMAAATGSWAAAQVLWSWYELVVGEVPLLSLADVGFLAFSLLGAVGLVTWLRDQHTRVRAVRDALDGSLIAGALIVLSFGTTVSVAAPVEGGDDLAYGLSIAYAIADVVLLTMAMLTISRAGRSHRVTLMILAAGMGGLAISDSLYIYFSSTGEYTSGNLVSAGWVTGFLLIGAAALHSRATSGREPEHLVAERPSRLRTWLPYIPLLIAETFFALRLTGGTPVQSVEIGVAFGLFALVVARQFLVLADNHSLMTQLRRREAELAHQAFHDPLTGLANRAQFMERIGIAAKRYDELGEGYGLLYCDLDDFKVVNDKHGHGAGDALLVEVGRRLQRCISGEDIAARLGGDEFAVLVCGPGRSASELADRVVDAVTLPVQLPSDAAEAKGLVAVRVGVSIGVATQPDRPSGPVATPRPSRRGPDLKDNDDDLLKVADRAMYLAKAAGKGQSVLAPTW